MNLPHCLMEPGSSPGPPQEGLSTPLLRGIQADPWLSDERSILGKGKLDDPKGPSQGCWGGGGRVAREAFSGVQLPALGIREVVLRRRQLQEWFPQVAEALGTRVSQQQLGVLG